MNLPNKLTIFRMFLVPVIMVIYAIPSWREQSLFYPTLSISNFLILIVIFIGAITDFIDGKIARKYNLITDFGKFLDPLADKLLVITGLVILMDQNTRYGTGIANIELFSWWMLAIILAREFIVTGIRLIAVEKKRVIAASIWGKMKTTVQFVTVIYLFAGCFAKDQPLAWGYVIIGMILVYATLVTTVFSGIDYYIKNKDILFSEKDKKTKKKNKKEAKAS